MYCRALVLVLAALPAVCLAVPAPLPRAERRAAFEPPNTLDDLARIAARGGDVRRGAAFLKPRYAELDDLEQAYKPRRRGGVGVGPPGNTDGIEQKLFLLLRRPLTAVQVADQRADLLRVAHYSIAITEVARLFAPEKPRPNNRGAREWNAYADEVIRGARDLVAAARNGDPKGVQAAAVRTHGGCNECHAEFRD
jgi:hypothetical protein